MQIKFYSDIILDKRFCVCLYDTTEFPIKMCNQDATRNS